MDLKVVPKRHFLCYSSIKLLHETPLARSPHPQIPADYDFVV